MTTSLRDAFRFQAQACVELGSPFMGQLCTLLADRLAPGTPLTDRMFNWPGDLSPKAESVPLRLCGALHALRLQDRAELAQVYPPHQVDDATLWHGVDTALRKEADFIFAFIDNAPQTNEVRRQVALIGAGHYLTERYPLPFVVTELGASAGLNLTWDGSAVDTDQGRLGAPDAALVLRPDWTGPLPAGPHPNVVDRRGVDLNPLDSASDGLRLRAYLWPDQPERLHLTDIALQTAKTRVDRADAIDWLADHLTTPNEHLHLIYTTIAWQYFPTQSQIDGTHLIEAAGARATDTTPLAWLAMETDGQSPGAGLTLRLWPGDIKVTLGRVDFHGRWITWAPTRD